MSTRTEIHWWLVCLFWVVFIVLLAAVGCDDNTSPHVRYLGPPIIRPMSGTDGPVYLDAWELDGDSFPLYAAFGWTSSFTYATGDSFAEPGVHTTFTITDYQVHTGPPGLIRFVSTGEAGEEDESTITAISGADGLTNFYAGLRRWPQAGVWAEMAVSWQVIGMDEAGRAHSAAVFAQGGRAVFDDIYGGAYWDSRQDGMVRNTALLGGGGIPKNQAMMISTGSPPKVPIAEIPPALVECANSLDYPPYEPGAGGVDPLIRSRWLKVRVDNGGWALDSAPFITPLPCDANSVESVVNAAWPYTVSFHAPAESAELGVIDAELSIVDPNGVSAVAIGIQIHEVDQCMNCGEWLWRSDYVIPLTGPGTGSLKVETAFGPVLIAWLPRGYRLKIEPAVNARTIYILSKAWLARDSVLDLDENEVVNFRDYGILLGMR